MTIVSYGVNHEETFRQAYICTLSYLHLIGAKPAPKKCYTFSTLAITRIRLQHYLWEEVNATIPVATSIRDLGGHLCTTAKLQSPTLTLRMKKANAFCNRLAFFPWPTEAKLRVVQTLILPLALYGCEASPASNKEIDALSVAIAKAIAPYSTNSCKIRAGHLASPETGLDCRAAYCTEVLPSSRESFSNSPA